MRKEGLLEEIQKFENETGCKSKLINVGVSKFFSIAKSENIRIQFGQSSFEIYGVEVLRNTSFKIDEMSISN